MNDSIHEHCFSCVRLLLLTITLGGPVVVSAVADEAPAAQAFVKTNCLDCHSADVRRNNADLTKNKERNTLDSLYMRA